MKLRLFVAFCLIFSSLLSINKLFEYSKENNDNDSLFSQFQYEYPLFALLDKRNMYVYNYILFIHYLINDVVLFVIQIIVDIQLVIIIRRDLSEKRQKLKNLSDNKKEENTIQKLDYLHHVSNETNRMIVYSLFMNAFFRFPEFSLYVYLNFFFEKSDFVFNSHDYSYFDCSIQFCTLLVNLIQFIYLLSYSSYIFFYFKYNKSFRKGFRRFFNREIAKK